MVVKKFECISCGEVFYRSKETGLEPCVQEVVFCQPCKQNLAAPSAFLQGLIFGRALCALLRHDLVENAFYSKTVLKIEGACDVDKVETHSNLSEVSLDLADDSVLSSEEASVMMSFPGRTDSKNLTFHNRVVNTINGSDLQENGVSKFHTCDMFQTVKCSSVPYSTLTKSVHSSLIHQLQGKKNAVSNFRQSSSSVAQSRSISATQARTISARKSATSLKKKYQLGRRIRSTKHQRKMLNSGSIMESDGVKGQDRESFVLKCNECGEILTTFKLLQEHYSQSHNDKLLDLRKIRYFSCSDCGKILNTKYKSLHMKKCHKDKLTLSCQVCSKRFSTRTGVSLHMRMMHKAGNPQECEECLEKFPSKRELDSHKSKAHGTEHCICHICGKHFKFRSALKPHLDAHIGIKRHFCEVCGKGFVRVTSLCSHRQLVHPSDEDRTFACGLCHKSFTTTWLLNAHLREKHYHELHLQRRKRMSSNLDIDANCDVCKNPLVSKNICSIHGPQPKHICDVCKSMFTTQHRLNVHMKLHTGERAYHCEFCSKSFTSPEYVRLHMKQHKEPRFVCDVCGRKFTYKCNLTSHRTTHFAEKPFQCEVCHKTFRLRCMLNDHIRKHKQELQFKCHICGKGLTRRQNLLNHIKKMHPDTNEVIDTSSNTIGKINTGSGISAGSD